jgi:hypothetical protein
LFVGVLHAELHQQPDKEKFDPVVENRRVRTENVKLAAIKVTTFLSPAGRPEDFFLPLL